MAGDSTLNALLGAPPSGWSKNIYHRKAPQGAPYPLVIFQKQSGTPTYAFATDPAYENDLWLIKGVDRGTTADGAEAIQGRLDALLTDGALSISGETQLYMRRESDVEYDEVSGDQTFHHAGSLYRLLHETT
jgi:hypothetical protein